MMLNHSHVNLWAAARKHLSDATNKNPPPPLPPSSGGNSVRPQLLGQLADAGRLGVSEERVGLQPLRRGGKRGDPEGLQEREGDRRPPLRLQAGSGPVLQEENHF